MTRFKNKTIATLLAAVLGTLGLHQFYLRGSRTIISWLYPAFFVVVGGAGLYYLHTQHPDLGSDSAEFLHPALLVAFLPGLVACVEALVYALTPDARWDETWNAGSAQHSNSGWPVIVIAILTLGLGATALLSIIAISVQVAAGGSA